MDITVEEYLRTKQTWMSMHYRCNDIYNIYYGGRGIRVCERWSTFTNFLEDMGVKPIGLTIERKDPNGHYCKENCKWATWKEQANNKCVKLDNQDQEFFTSIRHILESFKELEILEKNRNKEKEHKKLKSKLKQERKIRDLERNLKKERKKRKGLVIFIKGCISYEKLDKEF